MNNSMKNIVQVAGDAGTFNTLLAAMKEAGLTGTLEGTGPFTVFAPNDTAFATVPTEKLDALLADREQLTSVLGYHVITGKVLAADLIKSNGAKPDTVNGQPLNIVVRNGKVMVNGANVITADIQASNGVIHVIDAVLKPKAVAAPAGR